MTSYVRSVRAFVRPPNLFLGKSSSNATRPVNRELSLVSHLAIGAACDADGRVLQPELSTELGDFVSAEMQQLLSDLLYAAACLRLPLDRVSRPVGGTPLCGGAQLGLRLGSRLGFGLCRASRPSSLTHTLATPR